MRVPSLGSRYFHLSPNTKNIITLSRLANAPLGISYINTTY